MSEQEPTADANLFRRQGDFWTISFERDVVHLRDAKGMRYIAALLCRPGAKIHAADLRAAGGVTEPAGIENAPAERARLMVTQRIKASLQRIAAASPALGSHLRRSLHTGIYCQYDPSVPVSWSVSPLFGSHEPGSDQGPDSAE